MKKIYEAHENRLIPLLAKCKEYKTSTEFSHGRRKKKLLAKENLLETNGKHSIFLSRKEMNTVFLCVCHSHNFDPDEREKQVAEEIGRETNWSVPSSGHFYRFFMTLQTERKIAQN